MAEERLKDELQNITEQITKGHHFLLSGGAGSGKTYTLVQVVKWIIENYPSLQVACITYTNAAVKEIAERVNHDNLVVATIHDFLWDNIKNYQKELSQTVIRLLNMPDSGLHISGLDEIPVDYFCNRDKPVTISYQEHTNLKEGILSHDEVIVVAYEMFKEYKKLCDILKSRYPFILIDEYQDTFPMVIEIMLGFLKQSDKKNIIGFFGDAMQCIYDKGVGDLNKYKFDGTKGEVYEVQKCQNRRNPSLVIDLANKIRTDGLVQEPSNDDKAPNMENGHVKSGEVLFVFSQQEGNVLPNVRSYLTQQKGWNFHDAKVTKELNLTHNLIAGKAGFANLMEIYNGDPILGYVKNKVKPCAEAYFTKDEMEGKTLADILNGLQAKGIESNQYEPTKTQKSFITSHALLYERAKKYKFESLIHTYVDKSQLVDDKKQSEDEESKTGSKRSPLVKHLCRIEQAIRLFKEGNVSEFLKVTGYTQSRYSGDDRKIKSKADKIKLNESINKLQNADNKTIRDMIELADKENICLIDDKVDNYKERYPYIYDRMMEVSYSEFVSLYDYLEGQTPFSTQHKTKGAEFDNVLVILDNGRWNNYNFEKLFTASIDELHESVVQSTRKIFYVCCTRTKEKLAVYYHKPTAAVLAKARELFGIHNVIEIPKN